MTLRGPGVSDIESWTPMWWPCGPLEVERRGRRQELGQDERRALELWSDPESLELLKGSRVSGLIVSWAGGQGVDESHQQRISPLIGAARRLGLRVVGWVDGVADLRRATATARSAGLDAVATRSGDVVPSFLVLRFRDRDDTDLSPADFVGVTGNPFPGMTSRSEQALDAWTGASRRPWIDSNAWYVRLVRALAGPKAVWLSSDPPEERAPFKAAAYLHAIADAEAYGARWMVSLDAALRLGLAERRPTALATWSEIGRGLSFFESHRGWDSYTPVGHIGVMSGFAGPNRTFAAEVLNLLARQNGLYQILPTGRAPAPSLDALKAVLYLDSPPPEKALAHELYRFAESGGTLITPPGWERRGEPDADALFPGFDVRRYGQGRLAVARGEVSDPYRLAEDAQLLTSHAHDAVRAFNLGNGLYHYAVSEDGATGALQVIRFNARLFEEDVTFWFRKPWASARLWTIASDEAAALPAAASAPGVEFQLPRWSVYCALEVKA
jgi:hypothetical protein